MDSAAILLGSNVRQSRQTSKGTVKRVEGRDNPAVVIYTLIQKEYTIICVLYEFKNNILI